MQKKNDDGWMEFSEDLLYSVQEQKIAIWINGTADWCITCKVNEKAVLDKYLSAGNWQVEGYGVQIIKARIDYTNSNPEALKFFEKYGRSGVPFDLLLMSDGTPILMSEILTKDAVIEALEKAY
jgi:thiol:disulfide interchange protein DsbD